MSEHTTTAETDAIRTVRNYAEAKNDGDLDAAMEPWHPEGRFHVVPLDHSVNGRDEVRAVFDEFLDGIDDYRGVVESVHGDECRVTVAWRLTGTLTGSLLGLPPTGASLNIPAVSLFELDDELIVGEQLYLDLLTLLEQAGIDSSVLVEGDSVSDDGDHERFISRFAHMWQEPTPEEFTDLFVEDGTLLHPTMDEPISREEIPGYMEQITAIIPDISLEVDRWAAREDTVLIEWTITGTYGGDHIEWSGTDRFTVRGDRAVTGVAYFDTLPLWELLGDGTDGGDLVDAALEKT